MLVQVKACISAALGWRAANRATQQGSNLEPLDRIAGIPTLCCRCIGCHHRILHPGLDLNRVGLDYGCLRY
eukprot:scaffold1883_cov396-Prasinococcus_capsulatus_cf.AAC.37